MSGVEFHSAPGTCRVVCIAELSTCQDRPSTMPTINDFDAYIAVNNQQLVHYGMRHFVRDRTLECWIPCVVGQKFSVNWICKKSLMDSCGDVSIDGVDAGGITINLEVRSEAKKKYAKHEEIVHAEMFSSHRGERFTFKGKHDHDGAREIRLVINRTGSPSRSVPTHRHIGPVVENTKLLREEAPIKRVEIIATFVFKYRDLSVLRSMGLLETQPTFETIRGGWESAEKYKTPNNDNDNDLNPSVSGSGTAHTDDPILLDLETMRNTDPSTWSKSTKRNFDEMTRPTDADLAAEIRDLERHLRNLVQENNYRDRRKHKNAKQRRAMRRFASPVQYMYRTRSVVEAEGKESPAKRAKVEDTDRVLDQADN
ncbi:hypothetical protein JR316_0005720 [Psilocybe cubensis]|uniref:Uncharacterized protein n=2 Tax=Psilocybe cubensis TaxID=181762 RepID=A0ACB8H0D6_PSICU|nr:hypothetical protein JR316_0005720 [Psilocybe cubensis]KAH9481200.1 hypothetical protein JR316_0005720 [Psilocybe cubensis]